MDKEIQMSNVPKLTADKVVDYMSAAFASLCINNLPFSSLPPIILWGPPGVGKSQAVHKVADEVSRKTGKKTKVIDVRLLLFNPIDLRGIPVANEKKDAAVWLKPAIFNMDDSDDVINFLFLDEITAAPPSVQAAAYQITLDRTIGEHKLPDNCIIVAAGNRTTDKSVAYKMPKALANRLMHVEISTSFDAWRKWAVEKGINKKVLGFLSFRQDYLLAFDSNSDDVAFATPRSWEMASNVLNNVSDDVSVVYPFLAGILGTGVASELSSWTKVYDQLPSISDIFEGKRPKMPTGSDALYALISSMTVYAREHKDDMEKIVNSIEYAMDLPADFSAVLIKDYMYLENGYKERLFHVPEFTKWLRVHGGRLNGIV